MSTGFGVGVGFHRSFRIGLHMIEVVEQTSNYFVSKSRSRDK